MDREKVIRGLETCRTRVHCKECPYVYDERANDSYCEAVLHNDVLALLKEQEHKDRMYHALEDDWKRLKELLKEQEAVAPILIREGRNNNYNDYVCPRCDNEVVYEQNYCSECGVRFLWEGR